MPGAVSQISYWVGDWTVIVASDRLLDVMRFLRDNPATAFDYCSDVTASRLAAARAAVRRHLLPLFHPPSGTGCA